MPNDFISEIQAGVRGFGSMSTIAPTGSVSNLGGNYFSGFHSHISSTTTPSKTGANAPSDVSISGGNDHIAIPGQNDQWFSSDITEPWWCTVAMMTASGTATPGSFISSSLSTPFFSNPGSTRATSGLQSSPKVEAADAEELRTKRIAVDLLTIQRYDIAFRITRHIHDEEDEIWIPPTMREQPAGSMNASTRTNQRQVETAERVPKHLRLIPADADFLIHVFFEVSRVLFFLIIGIWFLPERGRDAGGTQAVLSHSPKR